MELVSGHARLHVYGRDNRAKFNGEPIMVRAALIDRNAEAEFTLTRGECKDLRDALIAALDATEGPANG